MTEPDLRIRFQRIAKRFPGVQALADVTFDVRRACVHALVGENGAGKSTLVKVLAGAHQTDGGSVFLDGSPVHIRNARHAQSLGIAIVYQEFNLVPDLSVSENVYLGRWPRRGPLALIDYPRLHDQTTRLFDTLGVTIPVRRTLRGLSVAQQQMTEIAKALSLDARVLVLDEPSAVLTPHELAALFELIGRLKQRGVSVLYISHRLDEVFTLADFVTVLRDGRHIATRPILDTTRAQLIRDMVGRPIDEEFPPRSSKPGPAVLCVKNLDAVPRFQNVSLEVRAGEVFGLTGLVGSGRSSLARTIFGAIRAGSGEVLVADRRGPFDSPRAAQRAGIAFLPEDRKQSGLLLARPLRENVTLAHLRDVATAGVVRRHRERSITRRQRDALRIRASSVETPVGTLSGGNQQKVMLARWLQKSYPVIMLDEPTRGVDVGAKVEIYSLINDLAARGAAVLMISSEFPEVIGLADRIGVMRNGRLIGILENSRREVTQEMILRLAIGEARTDGHIP